MFRVVDFYVDKVGNVCTKPINHFWSGDYIHESFYLMCFIYQSSIFHTKLMKHLPIQVHSCMSSNLVFMSCKTIHTFSVSYLDFRDFETRTHRAETMTKLQRVRLANRGRLLFRTSGPVPFGTCICSNVETIFSWTDHVCRLWISNIPQYFYFASNPYLGHNLLGSESIPPLS